MQNKQQLKESLLQMLSRKQGKEFYAQKLGVSVAKVDELLAIIRSEGINPHQLEKKIENPENKIGYSDNTITIEGYYDHPPQPEEVIKDHKIDTKKWKLSACWSIQKGKGWRVSAQFTPLKMETDSAVIFQDFLSRYKPKSTPVKRIKAKSNFKEKTCLIINKQDAHYNKLSIKGDNSIEDRFSDVYYKTEKILKKASLSSDLQKVIYAIGSDLFNSEATGTTTHGTPQQNIGLYDESFEMICNHEIETIDLILEYTDAIDILYVAGNHDLIVSWHLVNWLKAYYRNNKKVSIKGDLSMSKYIKFSNSALMFNHGYKAKPEQLAQNFPIEFKSEWSNCDHFYCFLGDKHTELSKEIGGIKFFRLSQMSNAVSRWDDENGYSLQRGCLTAFLVEEDNGITDTYREIL